MSDSITPFGTTRSVFSLATNDLEINGDIIASKFVGSGDKLTNITIKSINESTFNNNYVLDQTLGGTGSSTFIDKGILFNNETFRTLESTPQTAVLHLIIMQTVRAILFSRIGSILIVKR